VYKTLYRKRVNRRIEPCKDTTVPSLEYVTIILFFLPIFPPLVTVSPLFHMWKCSLSANQAGSTETRLISSGQVPALNSAVCPNQSRMGQKWNACSITKTLHGLSPRANYTDRSTAACRRSDSQLLRIEDATWSA
jgi:hypothetical protein